MVSGWIFEGFAMLSERSNLLAANVCGCMSWFCLWVVFVGCVCGMCLWDVPGGCVCGIYLWDGSV